MIHMVSQKISTFGMLEYCSGNVLDRADFEQQFSLKAFSGSLRYRVKRKSDSAKLAGLHIIESSTGPTLVSDALRLIIERTATGDAEFFPAEIEQIGDEATSYWAINLLHRLPGIDMEKSEFEQTNFDADDPRFSFSYAVMRSDWDSSTVIARCAEQRNRIVVREPLKDACFKAGLKGLIFYQALDMTYGERSISSSIS